MAATNIQDAVDAAADGDTVWVTNGVYESGGVAGYPVGSALTNRVSIYKPITVRSVSTNPTDTIIRGAGPMGFSGVRGVYLADGAALIGFTVTNAATHGGPDDVDFTNAVEKSGGGVFCAGWGAVVSNCIIRGNEAKWGGGGAYGGTLRFCYLAGNTSHDDGGGARGSKIEDSVLAGNICNGAGGGAAGAEFIRCVVSNNQAGENGGGVAFATVVASTVTGNMADDGGAAYGASLSNCTLFRNKARDDRGGGAFACVLAGCTVLENYANEGGGGTYDSSCVGCIFEDNRSDNRGGGAQGGTFSNCTFRRNVSNEDGGAAAYAELTGCLAAENDAETGGGVFGCTLHNCTIVSNTAYQGGGATSSTADNCVIYFNIGQQSGANYYSDLWYPPSVFTYVCTTPQPPGPGNIADDPMLIAPGDGDYRLLAGSPCVNSGTNQPWMADGSDLDGVPRIVGAAVDMGAYEYPLTESGIPGVWLRQYDLPTDGSADGVDSDGDGLVNRGEYVADTIPTNAASVLRLLAIAPLWGGTRLDWQGGRDAWQLLEVRENLADTNESWTAIYGVPPPTPVTNAVVDLGATNRSLIYRIRAQR